MVDKIAHFEVADVTKILSIPVKMMIPNKVTPDGNPKSRKKSAPATANKEPIFEVLNTYKNWPAKKQKTMKEINILMMCSIEWITSLAFLKVPLTKPKTIPGNEKKINKRGTKPCITGAFGEVKEPSGALNKEFSG